MTEHAQPLSPHTDGTLVPEASSVYVASQWRLMWRKFRKHRLAFFAGIATICIYLVAVFAEFLAPFSPETARATYTYAPPQPIHLIDNSGEGPRFSPYIYGYKVTVDPVALRRTF